MQHKYEIPNQAGAGFRADLNAVLAAIASNNSGPEEPQPTFAFQWWADAATGLLKQRNAANSAWVTVFDRANHTGPLNWAWSTFGGTANAITLTPVFARKAYATGDQFRFRAAVTNTGAATINVGGLGAKSAVTVTGAALPAGYIRTDVDTVCVYDGTRFVVQRAVETGSNANGVWTRYEDGRQDCKFNGVVSQDVSSAYGGGIYIGYRVWVFPATFITTPTVDVGVFRYQTSASWGSVGGNPSSTQALLRIYDVFPGSTESTELSVSAEGRWY